MKGMVIIYSTFPDIKSAGSACKKLLEEKLAVCCNMLDINSMYVWEGKIQSDKEVGVFVKTHKEVAERTLERLKQLHPYEIPLLAQIPVSEVNAEYGSWMLEVLQLKADDPARFVGLKLEIRCDKLGGKKFVSEKSGNYWRLVFVCPDIESEKSIKLSKSLSKRYRELKALGVDVIGVYKLTPVELQEFRRNHHIEFDVATFKECKGLDLAMPLRFPLILLLDKNNVVRHAWVNPSIESDWEDVIRRIREATM